jgi:hypothetical protein
MAMSSVAPTMPPVARHGARNLVAVDIDSYNCELRDNDGFIGDRVSKGAFRKMIDHIRRAVRKRGDDPLGEEETHELSKAELDNFLLEGDPEVAGIIQGAVEDFSQELALVVQRFLKLKEWKRMERIVIGGASGRVASESLSPAKIQ